MKYTGILIVQEPGRDIRKVYEDSSKQRIKEWAKSQGMSGTLNIWVPARNEGPIEIYELWRGRFRKIYDFSHLVPPEYR